MQSINRQIEKRETHPSVEAVRHSLESYLPRELSSELISRWSALAHTKRYDAQVAIKTVKLNQTHIDKLARYTDIGQVLDEIDDQVMITSSMHYLGEKYTIGHMELLINSVFNFVKVGRAIESFVMPELCRMILEEYGMWLTFADLKLCLKRGITNHYGTTYDRIDTQVLFAWLAEYRRERFMISEQRRKDAERAQQAQDKGVPMPIEIKKKLEDLELKMKQAAEARERPQYEPVLSKNLDHLRTWKIEEEE